MLFVRLITIVVLASMLSGMGATAGPQQGDARLERVKREAIAEVERLSEFTAQAVDTVFSFGELGFQEFETSRYCIALLKKNGFTVDEGIAGIPTGWMASWGSGKPVIAIGSDIDCIPQASQKPGVSFHSPLIEGAPGHGEGHNAGQPLNITAALVVKRIMERERIPGTLRLWPGVAEEQLGTKAYYVRDGCFKGVDAALFTHVDSNLTTSYGSTSSNGLISVEYTFRGESAHSAGAPWRGRSALDAVELMNIGWNFRREHLRLQQRSHYVITTGGDQPNVVPPVASVWYFFRETDYPHIRDLRELGDTMAKAASMMTATTYTARTLGSAWPPFFNKPLAETAYENIKKVGLPQWSEADQTLARAVQRECQAPEKGLATELAKLELPVKEEDKRGGGSDDIGDISWTVPTITLRFPSNIPGLPGHNWINAVSMATPIAHKGATAGAKALALTLLDVFSRADLVSSAWDYYRDVQTKETKYTPLISAQDRPAIELNRKIMERYRPEMKKLYFDSSRHKTYLEQLGVTYPTTRK
jgi:aminobenzoyl-glutamate utilization protein B